MRTQARFDGLTANTDLAILPSDFESPDQYSNEGVEPLSWLVAGAVVVVMGVLVGGYRTTVGGGLRRGEADEETVAPGDENLDGPS